jgi:pyruvate/2-oxoglutarate dehydrogenase complex dihydrolipoamide acyltransferase (E2) component
MQRGLVWIGGVAVICVAAFLYFGLDGSEPEETPSEIADARPSEAGDLAAPAGEQTRASRMAAAREKRKAAAERRRAARERAQQGASTSAGEVTREGSSRAAAERRAREGGTRAGGDRDPRQEPPSDRAQIEALFREFAEAPRKKAAEPSDEPTRETEDEGDPESPPGCASAGSPIVMSCATDPWICNFFNLAFGLRGTIPVIAEGKEAIHIPMSSGRGEVWEKTAAGVTRHPTVGVTNAGDMLCVLQ